MGSAWARIRTLKMLTATQQHAVNEFAKSLSALGDDALIDTYHQAREDQREASAEGGDNLSKATQRVARPKRQCGIASLIIKAATSYGIRDQLVSSPGCLRTDLLARVAVRRSRGAPPLWGAAKTRRGVFL